MQTAELVRMANQIGDFFGAYPREEALPGIAGHIRGFWDPRMRRALYAHVAAGGTGLEPLVLEALTTLRETDPAASPESA